MFLYHLNILNLKIQNLIPINVMSYREQFKLKQQYVRNL